MSTTNERIAVLDEAMNRILDNRDEDEDGPEVTQGMVNAAALISLMIVQTRDGLRNPPTDHEPAPEAGASGRGA